MLYVESGGLLLTCDGVDDNEQIQAIIDSLPNRGGIVNFSEGTFTLGTGVSIPEVFQQRITLQGSEGGLTLIRHTAGTIDSLFYSVADSWKHDDVNYTHAFFEIRDLHFQFNATTSSTCLNFQFLQTRLQRVSISNTNATKQGLGLRVGNGDHLANGGAVWEDVSIFDFATNFAIDTDHIVGLRLFSQDPSTLHFRINGIHNVLVGPQAFLSTEDETSAVRFQMPRHNHVTLIAPHVEKNANGADIFGFTAAGAGYFAVYDLKWSGDAQTDDTVDPTDYQHVRIRGHTELEQELGKTYNNTIPIGKNGTYGTNITIATVEPQLSERLVLEAIQDIVGGTFDFAETLTVRHRCLFFDGTSYDQERNYTSTGTSTYSTIEFSSEFLENMFRSPSKTPSAFQVAAKVGSADSNVVLTEKAVGFITTR